MYPKRVPNVPMQTLNLVSRLTNKVLIGSLGTFRVQYGAFPMFLLTWQSRPFEKPCSVADMPENGYFIHIIRNLKFKFGSKIFGGQHGVGWQLHSEDQNIECRRYERCAHIAVSFPHLFTLDYKSYDDEMMGNGLRLSHPFICMCRGYY